MRSNEHKMQEPILIQRAREHKDATAIVTGTKSHSYAELLSRSASIAACLLENESDLSEDRIAYLMPASFEYTSTQWAIWRAGGIAVPLSLSATEPELEYTLTDSDVTCLVTNRELAPGVHSLCGRLNLRLVIEEDIESAAEPQLPDIAADRRAMILYTSGTTSKPKGVVSTHANIQFQIETLVQAWEWSDADCIPLFLPLHHIHGIINVMSCALWSGASFEPFAKFDMDAILERVSVDAYTVFMAVPTIYVRMIETLNAKPERERQPILDGFAKLRFMVSGSAALPASVHEQWTNLTSQRLLERYGMTEIGMALSNPYNGERRAGAVGQPLPGVEIQLVSESGDVVTDDQVPGEIQVRGPAVFLEYWDKPQVTADSFTDGWFRTGDMAVRDDGYLRIMGRQSVDIIKSGGYKLSALEIEAALLDHPAISECAIVGLPDETWGECVAAAIVSPKEQTLTLEQLKQWCENRISKYKVPKKLKIVDKLPRNAMGKVTKPRVSELF